ncbi:DNA polymerase IV [Paractinoplanes durhamensis]|uniref:DNA polymerase IV n=1 Tax=Paractinoplanes durhamensis TaxID=113563 RepID=A0ABQ3Z0M0_9ACTN|nr:DNA polymerase IV [Actinoplanes durhamensis]GIE03382.1 DNA polymerase IV [Actinoplanes durhamensis]
MRSQASIAHVDLDAMFAAVEQRDKVSLRGRPVIVGGVAGRGVVATASYEARAYGARSAMPTAEARRRCPPGTAFLAPRFAAYRKTSEIVMALLAQVSPLVEQVSIDEAYLDLAAADRHDLSLPGVTDLAEKIRTSIAAATGGVTASVGVGTSKLVAKIGSDLHKPVGLTVCAPGQERALLDPLPVTRLPGVGPATAERLRRAGVHTIGDLAGVGLPDLIDWFGQAHGAGLYRLARAADDRRIVGEREAKSVSAEETFAVDLTDRTRLNTELDLLATRVGGRLRTGGLSARTITIKVRHHDFTTITRSATRAQPTDDPRLVAQLARRLLAEVDTSAGIRLLGVGATTLADFVQDDLFGTTLDSDPINPPAATTRAIVPTAPTEPTQSVWRPGQDVRHDHHGAGWVWGSGHGRVTVRFEGPTTPPGPVRTFAVDDPALHPADPPDWTLSAM